MVFDFSLLNEQTTDKFIDFISHELYHLIGARHRIKSNFTYELPMQVFLSSVQEEAIADLIDKTNKYSLNEEYLNSNEFKTAILKIEKLNEYLSAGKDEKDMQMLFIEFGENGGHIPGRFMGMIIKKYNSLDMVLKKQFNPYFFVLAYNKSAKKWNEENILQIRTFDNKALRNIKKTCKKM
jgi:Putative zinc dependent peptidase (DUF5700)